MREIHSNHRMITNQVPAWTNRTSTICSKVCTPKVHRPCKTILRRPSIKTSTQTTTRHSSFITKSARIQISRTWLNSKARQSVRTYSSRKIPINCKITRPVASSRCVKDPSLWATSPRDAWMTTRSTKHRARGLTTSASRTVKARGRQTNSLKDSKRRVRKKHWKG